MYMPYTGRYQGGGWGPTIDTQFYSSNFSDTYGVDDEHKMLYLMELMQQCTNSVQQVTYSVQQVSDSLQQHMIKMEESTAAFNAEMLSLTMDHQDIYEEHCMAMEISRDASEEEIIEEFLAQLEDDTMSQVYEEEDEKLSNHAEPFQEKTPIKKNDPGRFTIPCTIGGEDFDNVLCDLGSSINLMPLSTANQLGMEIVKPASIKLHLADGSVTNSEGIIEDVKVRIGDFTFPVDFLVLDMVENRNTSLILGRPFLATGRALIDVEKGELELRVNDESYFFSKYGRMKIHEDEGSTRFTEFKSLKNEGAKPMVGENKRSGRYFTFQPP